MLPILIIEVCPLLREKRAVLTAPPIPAPAADQSEKACSKETARRKLNKPAGAREPASDGLVDRIAEHRARPLLEPKRLPLKENS